MKFEPPLILASRSPRRAKLLTDAGFPFSVETPEIDDATLPPGEVPPHQWVAALAFLKAKSVSDRLRREHAWASGTVLGADTVCALGDRIFGQPRGSSDARAMIEAMQNREHITITGVALLPLRGTADRERFILTDEATVRVGSIPPEEIDSYIASGEWRGKAGAYNLSERLDAGWPIECRGDPATVMGLPMLRLTAIVGHLRTASA